ncbi:MAG: 2-oxo acid dehydrogenase subunit E2 [Anaerolineales bacterium]|nr:2-oxo acid dehydrogenase subunit E2 [Anaerolineales bacterium]
MAETIAMPKLGFDMAEGTLVRWLKKEGETVDKGEVLAEIETDKATVEVESSASGMVRKLLVDEGAVVPVSAPIAIVGAADEEIDAIAPKAASQPSAVSRQPAPEPSKPAPAPGPVSPPTAGPFKASPLARRIATDHNLDLSRVTGSGPGGRIVRRDIEQALAGVPPGAPLAAPAAPAAIGHDSRTVPLTRLRQAIGRRMGESKTSIPHFYITREYKVDSLLDLRRQLNNMLPEDEKVSVNDFLIKAAALTLRQFPNLNASLHDEAVVQHGQVNVGVAVAVEGGLLTIVCRDADQKPLRQIAAEVKFMAGRARDGKVRPDDIEGSTISISNLGMYGVDEFIAIVNPPEAAILAVGAAAEVPVVENGVVKIGWRMKATISVDHRISDGAEAAKFMQALAVYLEEPLRLAIS